jgi:hypothetical protein
MLGARTHLVWAVVVAVGLGSVGCGGVAYTAKINSVEGKVEHAKEVQAETYAPYYYYSAKERVLKAREEAARADYGDALDLLDEADADADQAITQAEAVRKGAGGSK